MSATGFPPQPSPADRHRLSAAEGWLALGLPGESLEELDGLGEPSRLLPEARHLRCLALGRLRRFEVLEGVARSYLAEVPDDLRAVLHLANAWHWQQRTEGAYQLARDSRTRFPGQWQLVYDLACYAAQTGRLSEARQRFREALALAPDAKALKEYARQDPDLLPLRDDPD
ncbi:MAG: hypothetical protein ACKO3N_10980 [Verrucomicrobiota bacterium]